MEFKIRFEFHGTVDARSLRAAKERAAKVARTLEIDGGDAFKTLPFAASHEMSAKVVEVHE